MAAVLLQFTSIGLCEDGSWLITLDNGSFLHANSVGFSEDKVLVMYKLGDAEINVSRVCYITNSEDSADILQQKGEHVSKPTDAPAAGAAALQPGGSEAVATAGKPKNALPWKRGTGGGSLKKLYMEKQGSKPETSEKHGCVDRITRTNTAPVEPVTDEEQAVNEKEMDDFYNGMYSLPDIND